MLWPPKLTAPRAATPGPGLSSRSRASYGLWVTYSATPLSAGTPAGAVRRCPTLKPFSPNAVVSASQASASGPAAGAIHFIIAERWPRIPGRHRGAWLHARTEVQLQCDGLTVALLELRRHEPGRNARSGGDGLPNFLRRAGDLDFNLDGTASRGFFLHAHDGSS